MRSLQLSILTLIGLVLSLPAYSAGTLTPTDSSDPPLRIRDHHLDVVINNGFARTEVVQTFFNAGDRDLEAVYAFPIPQSASLAEVTILAGEERLDGEVIARVEAERVYKKVGLEFGAAGPFFVDSASAGFVSLPAAHAVGTLVGFLGITLFTSMRQNALFRS